jgi:hypothetical protein
MTMGQFAAIAILCAALLWAFYVVGFRGSRPSDERVAHPPSDGSDGPSHGGY